jgi:hypothetical protein
MNKLQAREQIWLMIRKGEREEQGFSSAAF